MTCGGEIRRGEPMSKSMQDFIMFLRRYIDDIFAVVDRHSEEWREYLWDTRAEVGGSDGVYPTNLVDASGVLRKRPLDLVVDPGMEVEFLDAEVEIAEKAANARLRYSLYDKRDKMPIFEGMRKFPHRSSVLDDQVKYRVLQNEMGRIDRRCSGVKSFRDNVVKKAVGFLEHGYEKDGVIAQVKSYRRFTKGSWARECEVIVQLVEKAAATAEVRPGAVAPTCG